MGVVDEDDLVEEITSATGWCIKSIDYRHVLNTHWNKFMTLNTAQIAQLKEIYAQVLVDNMDMDDLVNFATESIVLSLPEDEDALIEEIKTYYDDDVLNEMLESVSNLEK